MERGGFRLFSQCTTDNTGQAPCRASERPCSGQGVSSSKMHQRGWRTSLAGGEGGGSGCPGGGVLEAGGGEKFEPGERHHPLDLEMQKVWPGPTCLCTAASFCSWECQACVLHFAIHCLVGGIPYQLFNLVMPATRAVDAIALRHRSLNHNETHGHPSKVNTPFLANVSQGEHLAAGARFCRGVSAGKQLQQPLQHC